MASHHMSRAQAKDQAMQNYILQGAGTSSTGQDLKDLAELHSSGAITDAEYAAGKAKILA
jgi:hypothetical protein